MYEGSKEGIVEDVSNESKNYKFRENGCGLFEFVRSKKITRCLGE